MFTAKDMSNKLKELDVCEGIDDWIETGLYNAFIQFGKVATVSSRTVQQHGWNKNGFTKEMRIRGFHVECKSDQRDGDYYQISFPPQEL